MLLKEAIQTAICPCCNQPFDLYLNWMSNKQNKSILSDNDIVFFLRAMDKKNKKLNTFSLRINFLTEEVSVKNLDNPEPLSFKDFIKRAKGMTFNLLGVCNNCAIHVTIGSLSHTDTQLHMQRYFPSFRWNLSYEGEDFCISKTPDQLTISLLEESYGLQSNTVFNLPPETSLLEAKTILDKFAGFL